MKLLLPSKGYNTSNAIKNNINIRTTDNNKGITNTSNDNTSNTDNNKFRTSNITNHNFKVSNTTTNDNNDKANNE